MLRFALLGCLVVCAACQSAAGWPDRAGDRYEWCDASDARDRARTAIARGDYAAALEPLRQVLVRCPEHVRTHLLYVETAETLQRLADEAASPALDLLAEVRGFYENDDGVSPVWPYMRARLAEHDAHREDLLLEALRRDPSFYWAHLSQARIKRWHDRPAKALEAIDKGLAARPDFAEARLERAEVLVELGRFDEAGLEYDNYLRRRPYDRSVTQAYARLLIYSLESSERADALVSKLLEDDPEDVDAIMDKAAVEWRAGRPSRAVELYRQVLELDPTQARAVLNLANLYYDVLWRQSGEASRQAAWDRARKAYLYYLRMNRRDDRYDFWDYHLSVPFRLHEIEQEFGAYEGPPPQIGDF